jgi:DNA primase catalytic subunit
LYKNAEKILFEWQAVTSEERRMMTDYLTKRYINRALDILENKTVSRLWRKYSNINL